jgi:uncharacterized protein
MLDKLRNNGSAQLIIGLIIGIFFGFFLQKEQVTKYDAIFGQLLLIDFTVMKVMLSAIITGMIGVYIMQKRGLTDYNIKPGSSGMNAVGGLIFGVGLAILGYCPGTTAGAAGQGSLDALFGGITGMIAGGAVFAHTYPFLADGILKRGEFGKLTLPELLHTHTTKVMLGLFLAALLIFAGLEIAGL